MQHQVAGGTLFLDEIGDLSRPLQAKLLRFLQEHLIEGDIPLLATTLLQRFGAEAKRKISAFTPQAVRTMERYQRQGNVRELENRVKRAVIMAEGTKITPDDLDLDTGAGRYEGTTLREVRDAVEKEMVQRALKRHNGNVTRAATELDISRPTIYELMEKLGIPRE